MCPCPWQSVDLWQIAEAENGVSGVFWTQSSLVYLRERAASRKCSLLILHRLNGMFSLGLGSMAARTVLWSRTLPGVVSPARLSDNSRETDSKKVKMNNEMGKV